MGRRPQKMVFLLMGCYNERVKKGTCMSPWLETFENWITDPPSSCLQEESGFVWSENPQVHDFVRSHAGELLPYFSDKKIIVDLLPLVPSSHVSKFSSPIIEKMFALDNDSLFKCLLERKSLVWGGNSSALLDMVNEHGASSCFETLVRSQSQIKLFTPKNVEDMLGNIVISDIRATSCAVVLKARKTSLKSLSSKIDQFFLSLKWLRLPYARDLDLFHVIHDVYFKKDPDLFYKNNDLMEAFALWASHPSALSKEPEIQFWHEVWSSPQFPKMDCLKHCHKVSPFFPVNDIVQGWFVAEDFSKIFIKNKKNWPYFLEKYENHPALGKAALSHVVSTSSVPSIKSVKPPKRKM